MSILCFLLNESWNESCLSSSVFLLPTPKRLKAEDARQFWWLLSERRNLLQKFDNSWIHYQVPTLIPTRHADGLPKEVTNFANFGQLHSWWAHSLINQSEQHPIYSLNQPFIKISRAFIVITIVVIKARLISCSLGRYLLLGLYFIIRWDKTESSWSTEENSLIYWLSTKLHSHHASFEYPIIVPALCDASSRSSHAVRSASSS